MAAVAAISAALIGAGTAVYTSDQQRKQVHQQMDQAAKAAQRPGVQSAKSPTNGLATNNILNTARAAAGVGSKGALGGTLLTGGQGVSNSSLNLGGGTLLGS